MHDLLTHRNLIRIFSLGLILTCNSFPAFAEEESSAPSEQIKAEPVAYDVKFEGTTDEKLLELLNEIAESHKNPDTAPKSVGALRNKAESELPEYLDALHSFGYYDALISMQLQTDGDKNTLVYSLVPGVAYTVISKHYDFKSPAPADIKIPDINTLKPSPNEDVNAEEILAGATKLQKEIIKDNCLLSVEVQPTLYLEPQDRAAYLYYEITTGPQANLGSITISGNEKVSEEFIRQSLPLKQGQCFQSANIDKAKNSLLNTNLFATADIEYGDTPDASGQVPVTVTLKERYQRTFKAGISYMTDQGPGATLGWEHRNFFGNGEKLDTKLVLATLEFSATANYNEPFFYRDDQSLFLSARIAQEYPEAYTSTNIEASGGVERKLSKELKVGLGLGYRISQVEEESTGNKEVYGLFSIPAYAQWDSRNDILNPTSGVFARGDTAPYFDTFGSDAYFLRSKISGSTYFALPGPLSPILAVRGALGSITAADTESVPADLRFYAGGGNSVRGYGYQELGPQRNGDPYGGRSLIETAVELRFKATETMGGVIFLDGGNSFDAPYPDFKEDIQWGAGLGFRYYTDFGPVRLDVAVPVNKREEDDPYQLYVSLGQAF